MRKSIDLDHILSLTDGKDYGLACPPMDAQTALEELGRYFLGDEWFADVPQSQEQINTEIVIAIESSYKGAKMKRKCL